MTKFLNVSQETVINWLNALVDGTYERGSGYLFSGEIGDMVLGKARNAFKDQDDPSDVDLAPKYCCLGVLSKITLDEDRFMRQIVERNNTTHPHCLMAMLSDSYMVSLADMNDKGRPFEDTAQTIMLDWNSEHPEQSITHVINDENGKVRFVAHAD